MALVDPFVPTTSAATRRLCTRSVEMAAAGQTVAAMVDLLVTTLAPATAWSIGVISRGKLRVPLEEAAKMARRAPGRSSRIPLVLLASCALVTASAARAGGYPGSR